VEAITKTLMKVYSLIEKLMLFSIF